MTERNVPYLAALPNITTIPPSHSSTIIASGQTPYLDLDVNQVLFILFVICFQIPVLVFGMGTNVLNIIVYRMSGLRDSVSITFTALSISDLGYVTFFFIIRILALLQHVLRIHSVILLSWLSYYVVFYCTFFQDLSAVITVFAALQKCCCVAIPYLFKDVFRPHKTIVILICLGLALISAYIPIFASMTFQSIEYPPMSNTTKIAVLKGPLFHQALNFWMVFNRIVLPASSQGITLICLVIMAAQLKKSAKFRTSAAKYDAEDQTSTGGNVKTSSTKLGIKERRALTAVTLVLVLFIVSTLPSASLNYAQLIATSFFSDPRYASLRSFLLNCQNILIHISASVNFIIYFKYNTKFKETAVSIFKHCSRSRCARGKLNEKDKNETMI